LNSILFFFFSFFEKKNKMPVSLVLFVKKSKTETETETELLGTYIVNTNALRWTDITGLFGLHGIIQVEKIRVKSLTFETIANEKDWPEVLFELNFDIEDYKKYVSEPLQVEVTFFL